MKDHFSNYHPIINFTFFLGALLLGMFLIHPFFLLCSVLLSAGYYLTVKGRKGWKLIGGLLPLHIFLTVLNPLFNTMGETILFHWPWGKPYTLEAVLYGMALASMMVSVLLWFASYNAVMTSDKFLYLFGRFAPAVSLLLTMVLRLVPNYQKKAGQISGARKGIGKLADAGSKKEKIRDGTDILSAMTSWALEGGIMTADSMRSRGYGCGKRTSFSLYRFEGRDKRVLLWMSVCLGVTLFCVFKGGAEVTYTPHFTMTSLENKTTLMGMAAYILFLAGPLVINMKEEITWCILKSEI